MPKIKERRINVALLVLKSTLSNIMDHKVILFPFCVIATIQLFILEIFYFSPRYPLNAFFGPVISKLWNESYLHYPYNLFIVPKLFQYSQMPIYIFISSFLIATAICIIVHLNDGHKIRYRKILKEVWPMYVHIVIAAGLAFLCVLGLFKIYHGFLYQRAEAIRSEFGIFYLIKRVVIDGGPYFNLLISVFVSVLFAYTFPFIIIEKKKVFTALMLNIKRLQQSWAVTLYIVLLPSLLYVPVLFLRSSLSIEKYFPEITIVLLVFSILVTVIIDAVVYTAVTTYYLLSKDDS